MIYEVRQVATYTYASSVSFAQHVLRVVPVDRPGQRVIAWDLTIKPAPSRRRDAIDFFGNHLVFVDFVESHREITVDIRARVSVDSRPRPLPGMDPPWERVRETAFASADFSPNSPVHVMFASTYVPRDPAIRAYASASFPPGRPILEAAFDLAKRIQDDFTYDGDATDTSTPAAKVFAMRRGVCQDFSHVMISGLRGLGLPAAYVSGYLRTLPPPGQPKLEGADATHAWVSVWCGPELGWRGFDPTNGLIVDQDHIVLAIGRDFVDVAPNGGVLVTSGDHDIAVAVDVKPVAA
ncbi:transglutaminase family protein [Phreatobacter aquaticus]|uniref:Transglutaminase family protein n=1 Tax=Phreatobacter aquaticus TaxID=2570229 RepID=A0A4D7QAV3_9HYPH|nr:transglutaminase family protein [Phreatobacter aquaticus]QCK84328.1 transglutaminase family protein [Phreatobacter aquaticus]